MKNRQNYDFTTGAAFIIFVIVCASSWVTHVVKTIIDENYLFMAIGAFMAPIGVVHGFLVWIGVV